MIEGKKRVLILGAGIMQGPAIRRARKMGLETVVIDADPQAPLAAEADRFEPIDLKDIHRIEELAWRLKTEGGLDGIMTAGTDFSASVAWAAERLGLPGIPYQTALDASDKERMRRRFKEAGLPSPAFTIFTAPPGGGSSPAGALPFPYPVVVKPVDNMGARGCRRVDNPAELEEAVGAALVFSRSRRVIVEEYMEGPEFSVDAVVYQGKITICGLADRHIFFPPYFIEMGHTMPTNIPQKDQDALIGLFIRGVRALGIDNGAAKGDIKLSPRGPMIGEIAARLSGGYMSGWTYPYASGVDPAGGALRAALGLPPEGLEITRTWTSAERAFISIPGAVRSIEGLERARNTPGVKDLFLRAAPGGRVSFPENNVSKAGNIISAAPDRESAVRAAEDAARAVLIRLAAPDRETEAFLAGPPGPGASAFPPPAYALDAGLAARLERAADPFAAFMDFPCRDYLGRTPGEGLEAALKLTGLIPGTGEFRDLTAGPGFLRALIRGGYQGAAYHIDRARGGG